MEEEILVQLALYKDKKRWVDRAIEFVSRGPYTHCEIIIPSYGYMYSASMVDGKRVRRKKIDNVPSLTDNKTWDVINLYIPKYRVEHFLRWFETVNGKSYGVKTIIFNHIMRLPFDFKDEYICSEFCLTALELLFGKVFNIKAQDTTPTSLVSFLLEFIQRENFYAVNDGNDTGVWFNLERDNTVYDNTPFNK